MPPTCHSMVLSIIMHNLNKQERINTILYKALNMFMSHVNFNSLFIYLGGSINATKLKCLSNQKTKIVHTVSPYPLKIPPNSDRPQWLCGGLKTVSCLVRHKDYVKQGNMKEGTQKRLTRGGGRSAGLPCIRLCSPFSLSLSFVALFCGSDYFCTLQASWPSDGTAVRLYKGLYIHTHTHTHESNKYSKQQICKLYKGPITPGCCKLRVGDSSMMPKVVPEYLLPV